MLMGYLKRVLVLFGILTRLFGIGIANKPVSNCYGGNYTSDSIYRTNLNTVLSSISLSASNNYGFYNFSFGQESDTVNALAICRGDVEPDICHTCVKDSTLEIKQLCPNQKEAIAWYEKCMLRYSNHSIFHTLETEPHLDYMNIYNVTKVDEFNLVLRTLLDKLRGEAVEGGSLKKFAARNVAGPDFSIIYGLVQCSPDLSGEQCDDCLSGSAENIPDCCNGKKGAIILNPSCTLRYDTQRFYNETTTKSSSLLDPPPPPSPPPFPPPPPAKDHSTTKAVYVIAILTGIFAILVIVCFCIVIGRRKQRKLLEKFEAVNENRSWESLQVDFGAIRVATNYFSVTNKLGQGGFGAVYKGVPPNGQKVAGKRLSMDSRQGEQEIKNEVSSLAKLQHRNLVRLLGFWKEKKGFSFMSLCLIQASTTSFSKDAARRNVLLMSLNYSVTSAIDVLESITAHGEDRKLLKQNKHGEFIQRWNLFEYKLEKAVSALLHFDFEMALYFSRSSVHTLYAIYSLVYEASERVEASLVCFKDPPFPWASVSMFGGVCFVLFYAYSQRKKLFVNKRKQF